MFFIQLKLRRGRLSKAQHIHTQKTPNNGMHISYSVPVFTRLTMNTIIIKKIDKIIKRTTMELKRISIKEFRQLSKFENIQDYSSDISFLGKHSKARQSKATKAIQLSDKNHSFI
ncbi:CLUMA_CG014520, isoform A [Clunio marinus]|uniref:CLUMA_CG014520, isoform A n=1 Tax=Clunio marinus TaxID=568069 RepID=A0A1J1INY5_9DIPT|nr:CLUMA_CG014520, isoform A [Clunio marinus]